MENLEERIQREGLSIAPIKKRVLAYILDDLLISLIVIAIVWNSIASASGVEQVVNVVNSSILELIILRVVYQTFFVWYYGATLGKIFLKIRILDAQYLDKPTIKDAFIRAIVRGVGELFLYFTFVFAFFDNLRLTLQDRAAKTLVVDA